MATLENRYTIALDIKNEIMRIIKFKQADANTSVIEVHLQDNGMPVNITGQSIKFNFFRSDNTITSQGGAEGVNVLDASNGIFECILTGNTLSVPGSVKTEIVFTQGDSILSTAIFEFIVSSGIGALSVNYIASINEQLSAWKSIIEENETIRQANEAARQAAFEDMQHIDANEELSAARQGKGTLLENLQNKDNSISDINEFLADNTQQINFKTDKKFLNDAVKIKKTDYQYYQAIITNPLTIPYTNEPVGIYVKFDKGECPSVNCMIVLDDTNNSVPFQWEGDIHPNPKIGTDFSTYSDGSLKCGTIYVMATLSASQQKTYTIKVYEVAQSNSFSTPVTYTDLGGGIVQLVCGGITAKFQDTCAYMLRHLIVNGYDWAPASILSEVDIENNVQSGSAYTNVPGNNGGQNNISHSTIGTGVIFMDFISQFSFVYNSNIVVTYKFRMWANGKVTIDLKTQCIATIPTSTLNGVIFKNRFINLPSVTSQINNTKYFIQINASHALLFGIKDFQYMPELPDTNTYNSTKFVGDNLDGTSLCYVGWQNTYPSTFSIPSGSYWSIRFFMNLDTFATNGDGNNDMLKRMNRIYTTATRESSIALKNKFISLAKNFLANMDVYNSTNTTFPGCNAVSNIAIMNLTGDDRLTASRTLLDNLLSASYAGGTATGFYNRILGISGQERGLEFTGRDMTILKYLYNEYVKRNDSTNIAYITGIIHNLADAVVQLETYAGGNGQIPLRGSSGDNFNAEGSGLELLSYSLNISENSTRRGTYNRIQTRLNSYMYYGILAYDYLSDLYFAPTAHYHSFALFDFLNGGGVLNSSSRRYIMEITSPSGATKEIGYQYNNDRRGLITTALYIAGILYLYNSNISDLQQACTILEYVIAKQFPSGYHEYPLDNWGMTDSPIANAPIESQILGICVLEALNS